MLSRVALLLCIAVPTGLLLLLPSPKYIEGTVRDELGPVPHAKVVIKGTSVETLTDDFGRFRFPLMDGKWRFTASTNTHLIGGSDTSEIVLRRLPIEDCDRYEWVAPERCADCHPAIYQEWSSSAHSQSANRPAFQRAFAEVQRELPDGVSVCASCHAPTVPFDVEPAKLGELSGVHCDFCHKIVGPGTGEYGRTHGRYQLRLLRPDPDHEPAQLFFGPLPDVDRREDGYSPFYRDSRYCASCHEGIVFGVHAYSTYSEWLKSPARRQGQECQTCHSAPTGRMSNIAPNHGGIERDPLTLAHHRLFWPDQETMLRQCVDVQTRISNSTIDVTLTAKNVGHRVPTGFPDHEMILTVRAFDTQNRAISIHRESFRKWLVHRDDPKQPAPYWLADPSFRDTRLEPEKPRQMSFTLPDCDRVEIELRYRSASKEFVFFRQSRRMVE